MHPLAELHAPWRLGAAAVALVTLMACAEEAAPLSGTFDISTDTLDFGELPIGEEATLSVEFTNGTDETHRILSVSLVEGRTTTWDYEREGESDLEPGDTAELIVRFTPIEVGESEARIQVRTSSNDAANAYISARGVGTASTADLDGDGFSAATGDCDDSDAAVYPGAEEVCDGKDNDCDDALPTAEADDDYDGYRLCSGDCDDTDNRVHPGAREVCDGKDNDCDGIPTEDADLDDDGYTICDDDCDDADPDAWPGNPEECDFIDNDCSGFVDDIDQDLDGYSPCALGGDCDDNDRDAFPVVVDAEALEDGDGTVASPFASISTAMGNLDDICRTIVLMPGSYELGLDWTDGEIQFNGAGDSARAVTLTPPIDEETGVATDRIFQVSGGATLRLQNLTISGGAPATDGGLIRAVGADVGLSYVIARDSRSGGDGGAVAISSGRLDLEHCTFDGNLAVDDGGALAVVSSTLVDNGSLFQDNRGTRGGAILSESSNVTLVDTRLHDNAATDDGGALTAIAGSGLQIEGAQVWLNTSGREGGGLSLADVNVADGFVRNTWFQDNLAGLTGGGIDLSGSSAALRIVNNTFADNTSNAGDGGDDGAGVHVTTENNSSLYIWSNIFAWNNGRSALQVPAGSGASVAYNTAEFTSGGTEFDIGAAEDAGNNEETDPGFAGWDTSASDPSGYDLSLLSTASARDSGPADGEGPPGYTTWSDPDGSRNDRGYTGGPGASE